MKKSTIIVNNKKIEFSGNAIINIKRDTSNIEKMDVDDKSRMIIEINGNIGDLTCGDCNILINGNTGEINSENGKVDCNDVYGNIASLSLNCDNIDGDINTFGDVVVNKLNGDIYDKNNVFTNFEPIVEMCDFKIDMEVFHKKYGKGIIKHKFDTSYNKSISIEFDSEEYRKNLQFDSISKNKSIFKINNTKEVLIN